MCSTHSIRGGALEAAFAMAIGITRVVFGVAHSSTRHKQKLFTPRHPAVTRRSRVGTEFSAPRSQSPRLKAMAFHSLPPLYVRGHCTFKQ